MSLFLQYNLFTNLEISMKDITKLVLELTWKMIQLVGLIGETCKNLFTVYTNLEIFFSLRSGEHQINFEKAHSYF